MTTITAPHPPAPPTLAPETPRRCIGSAKFGIEAHEATVAAFPRQPSQKDGLGRMCREHWTAYVRALDAARKGKPAPEPATPPTAAHVAAEDERWDQRPVTAAPKPTRAPKAKAEPKAPRTRKAKAPTPSPDADRIRAAQDLLDRIDRMPAPEAARAYATDEAQAALALVGKAGGFTEPASEE